MPKVAPKPTRSLFLLLTFLGALLFVVRGYQDEREALHFRDFKQPYASARCVLVHCDPYSEDDTRAAFFSAGGTDNDRNFAPYSALYPPFSLVALTPVAALPYPTAHALWKAVIAVTFSIAVLLVADLCACAGNGSLLPAGLLAVFTASSTILLMLGQISGPVIALLAIGFTCLIRNRFLPMAVFCFLVAVLLKPHDAVLPILYLLFAGKQWRKVFFAVGSISILFAIGSVIWFDHTTTTARWLPELLASLQGNAGPGAVNDPAGHAQGFELTNLQAVFGLMVNNPAFYNRASYAVTLLLLLCWAIPVWRLRNDLSKHVLAIAFLACLTLLPVYHRQYDTRMLVLTLPATAYLFGRRGYRVWGACGLLLLAAATVFTSHQYHNRIAVSYSAAIEQASATRTFFLYRPVELCLFVLCFYFLLSLLQRMREQAIEDRRLSIRAQTPAGRLSFLSSPPAAPGFTKG